MAILTPQQIAGYMKRAGFSGEGLQYGLTVVARESGGDTLKINYADPHGGSFGMWQINGIHIVELDGSEITMAQCFDPQQSSNWAFFASKRGTSFWPTWSTAKSLPYPYGAAGGPVTPGGGITPVIPGGKPVVPGGGIPPVIPGSKQPVIPGGGIPPTFAQYTPPSSIGLVGSSASNPQTYTDTGSGFNYILAYTVAILLFVLISKTRIGYIAIYYALSLALIFLVVTQSQFIAHALAPLEPAGTGTNQIPVTV